MAADWGGGIYACYCFWQKNILLGMVMMFVPSLIVSVFITRSADLERIKASAFGKYYARIYTKTIDTVRFGGFMLMAFGSWAHAWILIGGGIAVITYTWIYGLFQSPQRN